MTRARWMWCLAGLVVVGGWGAFRATSTSQVEVPTVEVVRGDYVDIVEVRGDIRPVRSTIVTAPANAGELVILNIVKSGTDVKAGDVVAQFDAITLRRTVQERQSELRSANAELAQAQAQAKIVDEQQATNVMKASYDVQRAELGLVETGLVSEVETLRAQLSLADAKQRLAEAEQVAKSAREGAAADIRARERRIEKVQGDLDRANESLGALQVVAPADGTVSIMPNYRTSTPMAQPQEYRTGDRTYPMAQILELPDLTSVHLAVRIDESDRGQLKTGLEATVRADAVPDREYTAVVSDVSVLARVDFTSGWPPVKMFDLKLTLTDADARLRPGMSAVARIPVGQLRDVLLIPADTLFMAGGRSVVYVVSNGALTETEVQVIRRGRDQVALSGGVQPGDRIATTPPAAEPGREGGVE